MTGISAARLADDQLDHRVVLKAEIKRKLSASRAAWQPNAFRIQSVAALAAVDYFAPVLNGSLAKLVWCHSTIRI